MIDPVIVTLSRVQVAEADRLAAGRSARNRRAGSQHRFGMPGAHGVDHDRHGTQAEMAVAVAFGIDWPLPGDTQGADGDVGNLEVRATTRRGGRLIVHETDLPERAYVLVVTACPRFGIIGYYQPGWGLDDSWWEEHRRGGGAYYIPRDRLRPAAELRCVARGLSPDTVRRALERRYVPEADAAAVAAGVRCACCGAAADLWVDNELRCVEHR